MSAVVHTSRSPHRRCLQTFVLCKVLIKRVRELIFWADHGLLFACETCGLELSSKHALESHVNRKYKCVPPGQVQHECRTCDKQFTRKNLLDQHLRTDKHRQVVAAAEAAEGTGSTSVVASESFYRAALNVDSHNTTIPTAQMFSLGPDHSAGPTSTTWSASRTRSSGRRWTSRRSAA